MKKAIVILAILSLVGYGLSQIPSNKETEYTYHCKSISEVSSIVEKELARGASYIGVSLSIWDWDKEKGKYMVESTFRTNE
jgi:hypothetical protein